MSDTSSTPAREEGKIEWRPIPGFPGYRVSSCGRVQTCWRLTGSPRWGVPRVSVMADAWRDMTIQTLPNGYRALNLRSGDPTRARKSRVRYIHRVLLEAFVGPCPSGFECRHLDGNRTNNALDNLRWGTKAENAADQARHGTRPRGSRHGVAKLNEAQVLSIRDAILAGEPDGPIARRYRVCDSTIANIRLGRTWQHLSQLPSQPLP
jgi:hypothetical protein